MIPIDESSEVFSYIKEYDEKKFSDIIDFYLRTVSYYKLDKEIFLKIDKRLNNFLTFIEYKIVDVKYLDSISDYEKLKFLLINEYKLTKKIGKKWEEYKSEDKKIEDESYKKFKVPELSINENIRKGKNFINTLEAGVLKDYEYEIKTIKDSVIDSIDSFLQLNETKKENEYYEAEIRFINTNGEQYYNLLKYFMNNDFSCVIKKNIIRYYNNDYRSIEDCDNEIYQTKVVKKKFDFLDLGLHIVFSLETDVEPNYSLIQSAKLEKNSFIFISNKDKLFNNIEIAMSNYYDSKNNSFFKIELEMKETPYDLNKLIKKVSEIMNYGELKNVYLINEIDKNNIIAHISEKLNKPFKIFSIINQVITIDNIIDFVKKNLLFTLKLDGIRKLLAISKYGSFLISLNDNIIKVGEAMFNFNDFLLFDCEFFNDEIFIFDFIYCDTFDLEDIIFSDRIDFVGKILPSLKKKIKIPINVKKFYKYELVDKFYNILHTSNGVNYDGLIFQEDKPYKTCSIFKFKQNNTIDIKYPFSINKNNLISENNKYSSEKVYKNIGLTFTLKYTTKYLLDEFKNDIYLDNLVVESKVNFYEKKLILYPFKIRYDKLRENSNNTIKSNINIKRNGITKEDFRGNRIFFARKILNEIKRVILDEYKEKNATLLDVGSGQGGDINKWSKFKKVYAYEGNDRMIEEFKKRLGKNKDKIKLVEHYFSQNTVEKKDKIDLLTFFFSCIYFYERGEESLNEIIESIKSIQYNENLTVFFMFQDGHTLRNYTINNTLKFTKLSINGDKLTINVPGTHVTNVNEYLIDTTRFLNSLSALGKVEIIPLTSYIEYIKENLPDEDANWINTIRIIKLVIGKSIPKRFESDFIPMFDIDNITNNFSEDEIDVGEDYEYEDFSSDDEQLNPYSIKIEDEEIISMDISQIDEYDEEFINKELIIKSTDVYLDDNLDINSFNKKLLNFEMVIGSNNIVSRIKNKFKKDFKYCYFKKGENDAVISNILAFTEFFKIVHKNEFNKPINSFDFIPTDLLFLECINHPLRFSSQTKKGIRIETSLKGLLYYDKFSSLNKNDIILKNGFNFKEIWKQNNDIIIITDMFKREDLIFMGSYNYIIVFFSIVSNKFIVMLKEKNEKKNDMYIKSITNRIIKYTDNKRSFLSNLKEKNILDFFNDDNCLVNLISFNDISKQNTQISTILIMLACSNIRFIFDVILQEGDKELYSDIKKLRKNANILCNIINFYKDSFDTPEEFLINIFKDCYFDLKFNESDIKSKERFSVIKMNKKNEEIKNKQCEILKKKNEDIYIIIFKYFKSEYIIDESFKIKAYNKTYKNSIDLYKTFDDYLVFTMDESLFKEI